MNAHTLIWFRQDLRIHDNPALAHAIEAGRPILPVYIHAPEEEIPWAPGGASRWWLHHALGSLAEQLGSIGLPLRIESGPSAECLARLARESSATAVYWNRRYEPAVVDRDSGIKLALREQGLEARSFNAALLFEPHEIRNRSGQPFKVYTPFWKHLLGLPAPVPVFVDTASAIRPETGSGECRLGDLALLPSLDWADGFSEYWQPTREGALAALDTFVSKALNGYREQRDLPGVEGTSRLSPYLHFGQIGPREVWRAVIEAGADHAPGGHTFLSEVAWREFAHHLLFHFPETPWQALQEPFREFPYQPDEAYLHAWQHGQTGFPVVDAGMRQLWRSGWMHNRVRMIVASFLVKHLLQPWQDGARWFWDTLVDADLASNTLGWQWTAGCGADAAPYFRVFNPILQGEKFDAGGAYVRRWVPELSRLPDRWLHQPWEAPPDVLREAGVRLGRDYPEPVIGHREGRARALQALADNKARQAG